MTSGKKSDWPGMLFLLLFALPFAVTGVVMVYLIGCDVLRVHQMASWRETPAVIESLKYAGQEGSGRTLAVAYRYEAGGRAYTGTRVAVRDGNSPDNYQERVHGQLKRHLDAGMPFRCFYDPANPSDAVLYRGMRWGLTVLFAVVAILFGGCGWGLLIGMHFARRSTKRAEALKAAHPQEPWLWNPAWACSGRRTRIRIGDMKGKGMA